MFCVYVHSLFLENKTSFALPNSVTRAMSFSMLSVEEHYLLELYCIYPEKVLLPSAVTHVKFLLPSLRE